MQRWLAAILAVFNVANGLVMLFASSLWWNTVPGVPNTGPFSPHFVQDVGAALLAYDALAPTDFPCVPTTDVQPAALPLPVEAWLEGREGVLERSE